jgi:hypothetical protein
LSLGSFGTVIENRNNHVKPATVAECAVDERGVSTQVPVFVRQPGLQLGQNTRVMRGDDCLSQLELPPEYGLALELPDQLVKR